MNTGNPRKKCRIFYITLCLKNWGQIAWERLQQLQDQHQPNPTCVCDVVVCTCFTSMGSIYQSCQDSLWNFPYFSLIYRSGYKVSEDFLSAFHQIWRQLSRPFQERSLITGNCCHSLRALAAKLGCCEVNICRWKHTFGRATTNSAATTLLLHLQKLEAVSQRQNSLPCLRWQIHAVAKEQTCGHRSLLR